MKRADRVPVYVLEAPVCALELGQGRSTTVCPRCGRGRSVQTGDLSVELTCELRSVWLSSQNAVLIDSRISDDVQAAGQVRCRSVIRRWREGLPYSGTAVPDLCQLVAEQDIGAAPSSVEFEGCECGAVRRLSFKPLIVRPPEVPGAGAWSLKENPAVLVIAEGLRDILIRHDSSLAFGRAYFEGEYEPPRETFEGVRWDDLG